ncbi:hypothetical protein, partial [Vreelandella alkaliphila]|uniref:hypothetical protein n=1 Tax=Vreelandella alkaliphila TaxID=272774 RepID=UPI003F9B5251
MPAGLLQRFPCRAHRNTPAIRTQTFLEVLAVVQDDWLAEPSLNYSPWFPKRSNEAVEKPDFEPFPLPVVL